MRMKTRLYCRSLDIIITRDTGPWRFQWTLPAGIICVVL